MEANRMESLDDFFTFLFDAISKTPETQSVLFGRDNGESLFQFVDAILRCCQGMSRQERK